MDSCKGGGGRGRSERKWGRWEGERGISTFFLDMERFLFIAFGDFWGHINKESSGVCYKMRTAVKS